jgi:hypothetical protein
LNLGSRLAEVSAAAGRLLELKPIRSQSMDAPFKQRRARANPKTPRGPSVQAASMSIEISRKFVRKGLILAAGIERGGGSAQGNRPRGGRIDARMPVAVKG